MRVRPLRLLQAVTCAAVVLLGAGSCQSAPTDRVVQSAAEEDLAALDAYDARLLDLRLTPDPVGLGALRTELDSASARPGMGRRAQARMGALMAEAALLAGDPQAAKRLSDAAASLSEAEAGVWIVRAGLEPDPAKRLALLDVGIAKADPKARLLCERGEALLEVGRYAEAAQDLDEGLRGLDPRYRALYGPSRDRAFSLAQAVKDAGITAPAEAPETLEGQLTTRAMVERTFAQTGLLSSLSADPKPSYEKLLPALSAAGLLLDPAAPPDAPVARRSVAFFLWGIVARAEHDPKLLTRYRLKYSVSPVPDVPADAPWFDAALGVVEREIMDLPDGVSFRPDDPVTGLEFLGMLSRLKSQYP